MRVRHLACIKQHKDNNTSTQLTIHITWFSSCIKSLLCGRVHVYMAITVNNLSWKYHKESHLAGWVTTTCFYSSPYLSFSSSFLNSQGIKKSFTIIIHHQSNLCGPKRGEIHAEAMRLALPKNIDQYIILRWLTSWWILNVVYLYKCWVSRTDCSTCLYDSAAEPYLKCGWCNDTNKCVVREACNEDSSWIPYSSPCLTEPNITKVLERCLLGTLRSNDATATRTSPKEWICVLSVFIAIVLTQLLCQM